MRQLRKTDRKSWRKRLGGLVLVVVGIYLIVVMSRDLWELWRSRDRIEKAKSKVEKLEQEQVELKEQLAVVESEGFVEQQIRDELMLARPGETVVVLPEKGDEEGGELLPSSPEAAENTATNWQKWLRLFL